MDLLSELKEAGCNVDEGLARFSGNAAIYEKFIKKLPASVISQEVLPFIESGDIETAIRNAHTTKGTSGNLSITPLYKAYTTIVELFRAGKIEEGKALYLETLPLQEKIFSIIEKY